MISSKQVSKEDAFKKIKNFCSYQERSHGEVREKLYSYKLRKAEVEEIMAELIGNNFLNEERFARLFAGGKFRMKQWGRKKILYELQQKGVNKVNINIGLNEIDKQDYLKTLEKLAAKKWDEVNGNSAISRQAKVYAYLLQKGYEQTLISEVLRQLNAGGPEDNC